MRKWILFGLLCCSMLGATAQDTVSNYISRTIRLDEVVVSAPGFNVKNFIRRVQNDTTFYKAFKTLRIIGYTADNDIRILNKKGGIQASLQSTTRQVVKNGCRSMEVLNEKTTGNFYTRGKNYNYYTAELYASLFFTQGEVCGEDNLVKGGKSPHETGALARHKEQLKILIFNPGQPVPGVPVVGKKVAIFEEGISKHYDFSIRSDSYQNIPCYVFTAKARKDLSVSERDDVVIDELVTYFTKDDYSIVARHYALSYRTLFFDFNVQIQVNMTRFQDMLVPAEIHYSGNWDVVFKKRERAVFTARFYDFSR